MYVPSTSEMISGTKHHLGLDNVDINDWNYDGDTTTYGRTNERETTSGKHRGQFGVLNRKVVDKGKTVGGHGGQIGLFSGRVKGGVDMNVVSGEGNVGKFVDGNGDKQFGIQGGGSLFSLDRKPTEEKPIGFDGGVGTVGGKFQFNKSGFNVGGGFNVVEGAIKAGNEEEDFGRFGLSMGEGIGVRGNWGRNENHKRQIGFGMDVGPVSFDLKSTTVPRYINKGKNKVVKEGKKVNKKMKSMLHKVEKETNKVGQKVGNLFA